MKKNIYITFIVFYLVSCANNSESKQNKDITINTKMDSISYGMGVNLGTAYKNQEFDIDTDLFHSGFIQSYNGENVLISGFGFSEVTGVFFQIPSGEPLPN